MSKNYTHGGDIFSFYEKYGRYPVDFSSSLNPLVSPLEVTNAFVESYKECFAYPPYDYKELRKKISEQEHVSIDNICVSNGASELIRYIPILLKPKNALITAPAFSEYKKSLAGCNIQEYYLLKENNFLIQDDFFDYIKEKDLVFLTNPDNPLGNIISREFIEKTAQICRQEQAYLVVDECFMDLSCDNESAVPLIKKHDNLIIIKAFTKTYAFAGLRLGYAVTCADIIEKLEDIMPEWRVSMPAYRCGIAALSDKNFIKQSIEYIEKEKKYLIENLTSFDFKIYGSKANYIFFYCIYDDLKEKLEKYGILIRDCSNYNGLEKGYYRAAVKKHEDNTKLINALKEIIYG